jgi:hypothetical protein
MKTKLILILAMLPAFIRAGTPSQEDTLIASSAPSAAWWTRITPYGWLTATEGDMGVANRVAPVDISMADTLEDLEIAMMLAIEGGYDRWVIGVDAIYAESSASAALPAIAAPFTRASVDFDQFFGRAHAGYQVVSADNRTLTAFAGIRYNDISTSLSLDNSGGPDFAADGGKSWVDPIVGLHGMWDINDRWFLQGGGDIGGFGAGSDLIWQANLALGYRFTDSISALAGYRGLGVDYQSGGFLVDTVAHGPAFGFTWRF